MKSPRPRNIATWSIHHPIGVIMLALALIMLGLFALQRLNISLLPKITYPELRIRVLDSGVPASIMENKITRQLEEQLAITEGAIQIQSQTSEGRTAVDLSFSYDKNIDIALRDASTRLDRAKRFLPTSIDPPIIYKRDPSQRPVTEYVLSSSLRTPVELRSWADNHFAKWFINLPGVASVEVGGGVLREIVLEPNPEQLASLGLTLDDLVQAIQSNNLNQAAGQVNIPGREVNLRTEGRFKTISDIIDLPIPLPNTEGNQRQTIRLGSIAQIIDTHEPEKLRIRLNNQTGVKLSFQKQPQANTVEVVQAIEDKYQWLQQHQLLPKDIAVAAIADEAVYIKHSLNNAVMAAISGTILAMLVVFLFLGNLRRTLIIGSTIPIAVMVTFILMQNYGLTLNIMTLGGLALGIGLLVDNTIVMLENIQRHQLLGDDDIETAATEVTSAIVAATSTNLAAVLPFLFISGLIGLLFRELIFTISAAILSSMLVALTLVPALAASIKETRQSWFRKGIESVQRSLQKGYLFILKPSLSLSWLIVAIFIAGMAFSTQQLMQSKQSFLPKMDEGRIAVSIRADSDIQLDDMDSLVKRIETIIQTQPYVTDVYTQVGGFVFGRSQFESSNYSSLTIQLQPMAQRQQSSRAWIKQAQKAIKAVKIPGVSIRMRTSGIRGIRLSSGDDDLSLRIQGNNLNQLRTIADSLLLQLSSVKGLGNLDHSLQDVKQELTLELRAQRLAQYQLDTTTVAKHIEAVINGEIVSDFVENDQSYNIRIRYPEDQFEQMETIQNLRIPLPNDAQTQIQLQDIADIHLTPSPANIKRDNQQRIVEISASLSGDLDFETIFKDIQAITDAFPMPEGFILYEGGTLKNYQENKLLSQQLLLLAIFLVFVVMAVQYESLKDPFIILLSIPFTLIGIHLGITVFDIPISMPVWLGGIMLAGIVVNNAIVLVEYIEIERPKHSTKRAAILQAAKLRLRPILMTTLTTVAGMLPLALGLSEGSEMLRPLAITIVMGLSFSLLVSLLLIPILYDLLSREKTI
ncbi:MAG: efflux RND transporter permease subunit [Methylococcales bacterium]|jgi:CzcA family heavy metal efflux pump|nr:efflux RND transporter permease subunit [Methylococcales bacterium]MBT7446017.1 efflux RND transporter permease subunit [Methylococcales bacterium]